MKISKPILSGSLYTFIAASAPVSTWLASDKPISTRGAIVALILSLVAGATALKAFLSTDSSNL